MTKAKHGKADVTETRAVPLLTTALTSARAPLAFLCSNFRERNPAIASLDAPSTTSRHGGASVGSLYVEQQLAAMADGKRTEKQAEQVADAWLMQHGRQLYEKLHVPEEVAAALVSPYRVKEIGNTKINFENRPTSSTAVRGHESKTCSGRTSLFTLFPPFHNLSPCSG